MKASILSTFRPGSKPHGTQWDLLLRRHKQGCTVNDKYIMAQSHIDLFSLIIVDGA